MFSSLLDLLILIVPNALFCIVIFPLLIYLTRRSHNALYYREPILIFLGIASDWIIYNVFTISRVMESSSDALTCGTILILSAPFISLNGCVLFVRMSRLILLARISDAKLLVALASSGSAAPTPGLIPSQGTNRKDYGQKAREMGFKKPRPFETFMMRLYVDRSIFRTDLISLKDNHPAFSRVRKLSMTPGIKNETLKGDRSSGGKSTQEKSLQGGKSTSKDKPAEDKKSKKEEEEESNYKVAYLIARNLSILNIGSLMAHLNRWGKALQRICTNLFILSAFHLIYTLTIVYLGGSGNHPNCNSVTSIGLISGLLFNILIMLPFIAYMLLRMPHSDGHAIRLELLLLCAVKVVFQVLYLIEQLRTGDSSLSFLYLLIGSLVSIAVQALVPFTLVLLYPGIEASSSTSKQNLHATLSPLQRVMGDQKLLLDFKVRMARKFDLAPLLFYELFTVTTTSESSANNQMVVDNPAIMVNSRSMEEFGSKTGGAGGLRLSTSKNEGRFSKSAEFPGLANGRPITPNNHSKSNPTSPNIVFTLMDENGVSKLANSSSSSLRSKENGGAASPNFLNLPGTQTGASSLNGSISASSSNASIALILNPGTHLAQSKFKGVIEKFIRPGVAPHELLYQTTDGPVALLKERILEAYNQEDYERSIFDPILEVIKGQLEREARQQVK